MKKVDLVGSREDMIPCLWRVRAWKGLWGSGMSDGAVLPETGEGDQRCTWRLGGIHSQLSVGH